MAKAARPRIRVELQRRFWGLVKDGASVKAAAGAIGVSGATGMCWFREAGGVVPDLVEPIGLWLSFAEREEIAHLNSKRLGVNEIARRVGRHKSTISRELRRDCVGRRGYRASRAQSEADQMARRPKPAKLATNLPLRKQVQDRLERNHSPEQISKRLREEFPDDPEMQVSQETIYTSIYVQGRGGLRADLAKALRTGRALRKPRRKKGERRGRLADMVFISQRPPEVEDRAVPGHWEGDLIVGKDSGSAIGTLVERASRFTLLLHLPGDHGALAVQQAMIAKMAQLPEILRQTLTWDQGHEMANHTQIAEATGLAIYFCDPHSPWQRGSNENTNGLLRQYFPKGTDLSVHGPGYLDYVAAELNNRPRKTLGWKTPAEVIDQLLSNPSNPPGVALTG
jgi:transposase, IS30 family